MDIHDTLDEAIGLLESGRPRAFGAGVVVDRDRLLQLLNHARATLPEEVLAAASILSQRSQILSGAQEEADQLRAAAAAELQQARAASEADAQAVRLAAESDIAALREATEREREAMVDEHTVLVEAQARADDILAHAQHQAAVMRSEVDAYVDAKLAAIAQTLAKTLDAVEAGRRKVRAGGHEAEVEAVALT